MNPPCASCSKTVYPMEKLNCLDKVSDVTRCRSVGNSSNKYGMRDNDKIKGFP